MARQKSTHVDNAAAVGQRLRAARLKAGLRQRDLSFPGCTPAYISRVEAGLRIPSLQLLEEMGRRLGVSAEFLARGSAHSDEGLRLADAQLAQRLGQSDEARESLARLAESANAAVRKAAMLGLGEIAVADGETERAIELLEEYEQLPPRTPVDPAAIEALAQAYLTRGDRPAALALLRTRLAAVADDPLAAFRLSVFLANALIDAGEFSEAELVISEALASLGPAPEPIALARLLWSQSRMQIALGANDVAARYAEQALAIVKGTEHAEYAARAHHLIAFIELERGDPARALELLDEATPLIELAGDRPALALFQLERARALAGLDRFVEAEVLAQELVRDVERLSRVDAARALAVLAKVFAAAGNTGQALDLYEAAADALADLENAPMLVGVYAEWSDLLAANGQTEEALRVARRGVSSRLGSSQTR